MAGIWQFAGMSWMWFVLFVLSGVRNQPTQSGLVELVKLDSTIKLDIRYATSNNFIGQQVYDEPRAFLQRPAAEALVRVHEKLKKGGYGLQIFDGYRPLSVTKRFWDLTPPAKRKYVANPKVGSRHNRGAAVDLTIYYLNTGGEVPMPSAYDDMSVRAHPSYKGGTAAQRQARDLLISQMRSEGFIVNPLEWWHFDYKDWMNYPVLDVPFSAIR